MSAFKQQQSALRDKVRSAYHTLHQKSPALGKAAALTTAASVITANSVVGGIPLWLFGVAKVATGVKVADDAIIKIAEHWINSNNALIDNVLPERDWRIDLPEGLDPNKQYLLICNHQSWVDTGIVQYISEDTLPLTRFFTKHDLIYLPFVGQAFYFLDFPMMKRHSKEAIAKNPKLKGQDIKEAKRACQLLKDKPFALLNYLEGTRFTQSRHDKQGSPYRYLLKPKAGGLALAIAALGDQVDAVLDMTIVYPDGIPEYKDLWKGNIRRLGVHLRKISPPDDLFRDIQAGGYEKDEVVRQAMYRWIDAIWQKKDQRIAQMLADFAEQPKPR